MNDSIIKLPASCADVGEIEEVLDEFYHTPPESDTINIDMSDVAYITTPCMIYLIAFTDRLFKQNIKVKYFLPTNVSIRNIMRTWRFPVVLKEVTGVGFSSIVHHDDLKYFGENSLSGDIYAKFVNNDEGLEELIKKDFFSITSIPFVDDNDKANAIDGQYGKWSSSIVKSILKRHLSGYDNNNENLIPNRIIYECLTNAARHANSRKLITGSFFDKRGGMLTITYWDNDKTIVDTLRETLNEKEYVRSKKTSSENNFNNIHFTFDAKFENADGNKNEYFHSDVDPTKQSSNVELLISSFYPGISRDPDGILKFQGNPNLANESKVLKGPGMGLTTLLNATIDLLGGSIAVRTGSFFANIRKHSKRELEALPPIETIQRHQTVYRIKIKEYKPYFPPFEGNMITIRIPLRKA